MVNNDKYINDCDDSPTRRFDGGYTLTRKLIDNYDVPANQLSDTR